MRHRNIGRHFGRKPSHRHALFINLSKELVKHGMIKTTLAKAKEVRRVIEPLITYSKVDSLSNRRLVFSRIKDKYITHVLFSQLGKRYIKRPGGYTRIIKYKIRQGDCAKLVFIELVDRN